MAEKLSITIALEGGKQIEQQLEGIGNAGQKAFEDIQKAADKAGGFRNLKPEEVTQKLKDMGIVGKEALDKITGAVATAARWERFTAAVMTAEKGFAGLSTAALGFARALGPIGAVAGLALGGMIKLAAAAASELQKTDAEAKKLGLTFKQFDQLKKVFESAGASAAAIGDGISHAVKEIDKFKKERVSTLFDIASEKAKQPGGTAESDFTRSMDMLKSMAAGVGPAADAAREAVQKLRQAMGEIPASAAKLPEMEQLFRRLGVAMGDSATMVEQAKAKLATLPDSFQRTADAITLLGPKLGVEFVQGLQAASGAMDPHVAASVRLEQQWNKTWAAWERLKVSLGSLVLPTDLEAFFNAINALLQPDNWVKWGSAAVAAIDSVAVALGGKIWAALNAILDMVKSVGAAISGAFSGGGAEPGTVGPIPGNAAGGLIGGRGTGTSDSNLAWVSRGEHIMPARAVAQPGVLALLEALRRTGGNLRGVMGGMGRFAAGGMIPRFAEGGLVGGGMGHLGTVDLRTDHGVVRLMAGASAVEQLSRLAVTKRMTSTGRKPGFIG